ncbi:MAG: hypothetical protein HUU02_06050 [Bacteroidetes bacterium]|nr:hypothetical protein [Bacteroidota bacterium]
MHPLIPLPLYYSFLFLSVLTTALLIGHGRHLMPERKPLWIGMALWFIVQYLAGKLGFFADGIGEVPPRIMLFVVPNFVMLIFLAFSRFGAHLAVPFSLFFLTALQSFRIGVEIILWLLAEERLLPLVMSWEGRNVDVLVGLTAPVLAVLLLKGKVSHRVMIAWNVAGLIIVTNVVVHGMLSVPGIERIVTDIPNFIVSYAPFNLLPGVLVPIAYLLHILSLRKLLAR